MDLNKFMAKSIDTQMRRPKNVFVVLCKLSINKAARSGFQITEATTTKSTTKTAK